MDRVPDRPAFESNRSMSSVFKDQRILLLICIVGLSIITYIINPRFADPMNIVSLFGQVSVVGVMAMGMSKLLLSGGVDLSVGNIMTLSASVIAVLIVGSTQGTIGGRADTDEMVYVVADSDTGITSVPVAILIGMLVAVACGFLNGLIITKTKTMPLIITLGTSQIFYGLSLVITTGRFLGFKMAFEPLRLARIGGIVPVTLLFFIGIVILAWILVNRTKYGRRIVAIGGNEMNARLSGISVDKYKIITYVITGAYCGLAAIIYASRLDSIKSNSGQGMELQALISSIIGGVTFDGGKGTITGAFLGVMFMGLIQNSMNMMQVNSYYQAMITGMIIVGAVVISNIENIRKEFGLR